MSTYTSNSTNNKRTGPEQLNRRNQGNNDHKRQSGRRRDSRDSSPHEQTNQSSRAVIASSSSNENQSSLSPNDSICSICAEPIHYFAVPECNHKSCHLCCLRLRALYKNRMCAYCKTEQIKVIFTRSPDKNFQEFKGSDIPYLNRRLNVHCEDEEMYEDITLLLRLNCPDPRCEVSCEGWTELKRHVKREHRLMLCDICTWNKKIFTHEHSLFTYEELDKHIIEGDEVTGFKGHPECQFCKRHFYGDDELYEHCRDHHEKCFICANDGLRDIYFRNYNSLEEHFRLEHFPCPNEECLEKKFVVFGSDIDLKAHEISAHGANLNGQRANRHEAMRIETNFSFRDSYRDSYPRGRGRQRSRERQPVDDDGPMHIIIGDISRQTQNLNIDPIASVVNGTASNARAVRPPPGFGVLSSDEAIGSADELPENEIEIRNVSYTPARTRREDFPTLSDAMRVTTSNNNSGTIQNYSEKVKEKPKPKPKPKPKLADKPAQSVVSSSRSVSESNFLQKPLLESTNKRESPAFPPLPSANHSTSASSSSSVLNYREKAVSGNSNSNTSSRNFTFYQRVSPYLSNNSAKMDQFKSFTTAYIEYSLDALSYIESLLSLFNKNTGVIGKVVSGLVDILEDEYKKSELLSTWNDHKVKRVVDFPALEPVYSPPHSVVNNSKPNNTNKTNKPSARVLVIKSSTTRSGGTKASSGPVWDKIAAIAETKINEKNSSAFPSLATSATATTASSNNSRRGQNESITSSSNYPATTNVSSYTTAFVRGRPTKAENEEFPVLSSSSKSSYSQQSSKNGGLERSAWGQGGAFTSVASTNQNENDSEDDSSHNESTKEGGKKKKQKKSKNVLFHVGYKKTY